MNRTLIELARAMLRAAALPEFLWESAVEHAAYLRNRAYSSVLEDSTPLELWHGSKPDITHLREFGAPVWVLLQGQRAQRKMLPKSLRRAYVGHDDGSHSIKYYVAESRKILKSRNFQFLSPSDDLPSPESLAIPPPIPREGEQEDLEDEEIDTRKSEGRKRKEPLQPSFSDDSPRRTRGVRPDYRNLQDPFSDESEGEEGDSKQHANVAISGDDYHSLKEARESPEWPEWERAIRSELDQLSRMGTWDLVDKRDGIIPIANKWVFTKKRDKSGRVTKYKARLVAKGCAQRPGHDYVETHSPVVRLETIRAILALVPTEKLIVQQMDVKGAYLNGILAEQVFMKQPEGYEDGSQRVCHLIKTLYGLKQAGREWNRELDAKLTKHKFTRLKSDPCVYVRRIKEELAIITVWVDDLLLFASSVRAIEKMKADIGSEWEVTDLGEPSKIVGIEIGQTDHSVTISQCKYIENILKREGLERANPVKMPLDPNVQLEPNPDGNEGDRSNSYAKAVGELQFLANATRPDIAYAVNRLASFTANPSLQHVTALKRILRYLAGTKMHMITYTNRGQRPTAFYGYADAAYGNVEDRKSIGGYVFISGNGAITWKSKKQQLTALSSTEAEYIALSEAAREATWLRSLHNELGFQQSEPTIIKGDNEGSLAIAKNAQFHQRSKHIDTKWHFIQDMIRIGRIEVESCRDQDQTADILTKALPRAKHHKHTSEMGIALN